MQTTHGIKKVVWAIDPFEKPGQLMENGVKLLRRLANQAGVRIEPVYVMSLSEIAVPSEIPIDAGLARESFRPAARQALQEALKGMDIPNLLEPKVMLQPMGSNRQAAEILSRHAQTVEADAIVVNTHSREGVSRFLMGSFAETLLLRSKVPVLVVGPHLASANAGDAIRTIVFPTDLSDHSRMMFEYVVDFAQTLGASLRLFHSVPNPVEPVLQSGIYLMGGSWVPVHQYFEEDTEARRRKLQAWTRFAVRRRVPAEYHLDESGGQVAKRILAYAREQSASWIAMAAHSGPLAAALIGSISRQVVRHSTCPTLILHVSNESLRATRRQGYHPRAA